jgi:recombination protein RecA
MALPVHLAERFSPALARALRTGSVKDVAPASQGHAFGLSALDAVLPDGGFVRGGVVELAVAEGAPGTTLALSACAALQRLHEQRGQALPWCAFVDPTGTLYAPGVVAAGVRPERLLVLEPPLEALSRTVLRLAKSPAFSLVFVDLAGVPGDRANISLDAWPRLVRRLALEIENSERSIVLITERGAPRALPLPVAQRIEITRPASERLMVQVAKDRRGQLTPLRPVAWTSLGSRTPSEPEVLHARAS